MSTRFQYTWENRSLKKEEDEIKGGHTQRDITFDRRVIAPSWLTLGRVRLLLRLEQVSLVAAADSLSSISCSIVLDAASTVSW